MLTRQHSMSTVGFLAGLMIAAGCSTSIAYKPIGGTPPAPATTVELKVLDQRPADYGGEDKRVIGRVRGSYGIPASVADSNPDIVVETVSQATADALARAQVGVGPDGYTLVATVTHYWMDGFTGYKGAVTVSYALLDASGAAKWMKEISGTSGGAPVFKSAAAMTQDIFGAALRDLARTATAEFQSAEFQSVLK
jgi:hypothetical protein